MLACFTFCMSSISLKNCELAQKFALYFYMLHNICSCCSIFNDRLACPRSRGQLIYYTTFFLVCQGVFRKFFDFFQSFFRMLLSAKLFMRFLGAFLKAPVYYTTNRPFCQGVFWKFFEIFQSFFVTHLAVHPNSLFHLAKVSKDLLKAEMLHSSAVYLSRTRNVFSFHGLPGTSRCLSGLPFIGFNYISCAFLPDSLYIIPHSSLFVKGVFDIFRDSWQITTFYTAYIIINCKN